MSVGFLCVYTLLCVVGEAKGKKRTDEARAKERASVRSAVYFLVRNEQKHPNATKQLVQVFNPLLLFRK